MAPGLRLRQLREHRADADGEELGDAEELVNEALGRRPPEDRREDERKDREPERGAKHRLPAGADRLEREGRHGRAEGGDERERTVKAQGGVKAGTERQHHAAEAREDRRGEGPAGEGEAGRGGR